MVKVKPHFRNMLFGFDGKVQKLGERKDLEKIYSQAKSRNSKTLLNLFENPEITKEKVDKKIEDEFQKKVLEDISHIEGSKAKNEKKKSK